VAHPVAHEKTIVQSRDRQGADPLADARGSVRASIFGAVIHAPVAHPWRMKIGVTAIDALGVGIGVGIGFLKTSTPMPIATPMDSGLGYFRSR
jgi:hypothetical protein